MPYGIVLHAFPVMSYILLMKYQVALNCPEMFDYNISIAI